MLNSDHKRNLIVFISFWLFYLFFQSTSIYGGDAGDLVTAAYTGSTAHPPGYPLYSFLGYLASFIPLSTVAWRVSLLSSISMAGALTFLYMFILKLTQHRVISILAPLSLATTYLIWLYAIVPEVFGLHALFTSAIVYIAYCFSLDPTKRKLQLLAALTGLSLTHHHIIVFAFPAVAAYLWQQRKFIYKLTLREEAQIVICGVIGLLPYGWAYIAAIHNAPLVWDDPRTIPNFVRLITRADYGSFQSGIAYGQDIRSRLLQFVAVFDFYLQDFTLLGVLLFASGALRMWMQKRKVAVPLMLAFIGTGPGYFFYASYLFTSAFHIATAERFMIPSYLFFSIFMGYGIYTTSLVVLSHVHSRSQRLVPLIQWGMLALILILPLSLLYSNYAKLSPLKYDSTAEKFGRDILMTAEPHSLLLLQGDHPVFNTQYMYYAEKTRPDIKLVHLTKLLNGTGYRQLQKAYPELEVKKNMDKLPILLAFVEREYKDQPIFATIPFNLIPEHYQWVPYGLLYRLYKEEDVPAYPLVDSANAQIWSAYQDPQSGSLGQYKNLMLSNVTDYYKDAYVRRGLYAATHGDDYQSALVYYDEALRLDPQRGSIFYLKGDAYVALGQCKVAHDLFRKGYSYRSDDKDLFYHAMISLHKDCYKDAQASMIWQKRLDALSKKKETLLKEL